LTESERRVSEFSSNRQSPFNPDGGTTHLPQHCISTAAGGMDFLRALSSFITHARRMAREKNQERNPSVLHARAAWFALPKDKRERIFEIRFWLPSAASVNGVRRWTGLRSFSTCLVSVDFMLVTSPAIKDDKVCSRLPIPIRTGDPRGYNTGNVPPSYGPEDGNLYGDASHREAEDESVNVSKNMRRVPQNEAPAHGFSGGRTAQGTMSRSPEAAAQSGKDYDQETIEISTDKVM
jgi:hypothetical protein